MRLIDADALIEEKGYWHGERPDVGNPFADGIEAVDVSDIEDAPTVDAAPVVHGQWEFGELDALGAPVRCSHCGWGSEHVDPVLWLDYPGHQFCGACGTKMDLEEE